MSRYLGLGEGSDSTVNLSSYTQIVASCSGSSGSTSLTATNASFSAGQRIFIHQSRGTGAGAYEDNKILSYVAGTITFVHPLENDYTDSGASQAQVVVVPQATDVTGSFTVDAWDGDTGGLFVIACTGTFSGTINANGKGFRGASGVSQNTHGKNAEGSVGAGGSGVNTANGNGGGGGDGASVGVGGPIGGGAGGGYGTAGEDGGGSGGGTGGSGGLQVGSTDMTSTIFLGGGGGSAGAGNNSTSLDGGDGGGIIVVYANNITSSASLTADGENGGGGGSGSSAGS